MALQVPRWGASMVKARFTTRQLAVITSLAMAEVVDDCAARLTTTRTCHPRCHSLRPPPRTMQMLRHCSCSLHGGVRSCPG